MSRAKKLVLVLTNSLSVTETNMKDEVTLKRVLYIHYLLRFWKDITDMRALIDSNSKINAITPAYTLKLGLKVYHTDVGA